MPYLALAAAGLLTGVVAAIGGLGSLISFPALLLFGLPPVPANVTNTTALTSLFVSSLAGSARELRSVLSRVLGLGALAAVGGGIGAWLLLHLPAAMFAAVVPILVALGSVLVLGRDQIRRRIDLRRMAKPSTGRLGAWLSPLLVLLTCVYCGYFGAGAGIVMLAVLSLRYDETHAVTNAVRAVILAVANIVAAVVFIATSSVDWAAAGALAAGMIPGGILGMRLVPRLPGHRLRQVIGVLGLLLAAWLAYDLLAA